MDRLAHPIGGRWGPIWIGHAQPIAVGRGGAVTGGPAPGIGKPKENSLQLAGHAA